MSATYTHSDGVEYPRLLRGLADGQRVYFTDTEMAEQIERPEPKQRPTIPTVTHAGRPFTLTDGMIAKGAALYQQVLAGVPAESLRIVDDQGRPYRFSSSDDFASWYAAGDLAVKAYIDDLEDFYGNNE